jgi:hypothetical protein
MKSSFTLARGREAQLLRPAHSHVGGGACQEAAGLTLRGVVHEPVAGQDSFDDPHVTEVATGAAIERWGRLARPGPRRRVVVQGARGASADDQGSYASELLCPRASGEETRVTNAHGALREDVEQSLRPASSWPSSSSEREGDRRTAKARAATPSWTAGSWTTGHRWQGESRESLSRAARLRALSARGLQALRRVAPSAAAAC